MKKEKERYNLQPDYIYSRCMREWWPALDANKNIIHAKKGEIIFAEGAKVEGVYFIIDGIAKVHKHWVDEKELIIRFAKENDVIGHRGLSTHDNVYPISATALSNISLCYLELEFFTATLKVNPGFMYDFMMFFADELRLSELRMRDLAHMPVKERVFQTLKMLDKKFGRNEDGFISFPVPRQDIAAYTGAAYESVYKILSEFSATGIIRTDGKFIALLQESL